MESEPSSGESDGAAAAFSAGAAAAAPAPWIMQGTPPGWAGGPTPERGGGRAGGSEPEGSLLALLDEAGLQLLPEEDVRAWAQALGMNAS